MTVDAPIDGRLRIGGDLVTGSGAPVRSISPVSGRPLEPAFHSGGPDEVDTAVRDAVGAFPAYSSTSPSTRAALLDDIAARLEARGDAVVDRAHRETGLPVTRLQGELGRTSGQLRHFGAVLREGSANGVRIDPARATPARADIRRHLVPLGPVAVFGASNFPLAFSNAGGDTASALAAGCPVVVKAHGAHLGTAAIVSELIAEAVAHAGLPGGVYSCLVGDGFGLGAALVAHRGITAVGFTGSRAGGLALVEIANRRRTPIPVYAEMSSVNPVFVLPTALETAADRDGLASGFIASLTLGAGQFCTNPGLLFVAKGADGDDLVRDIGVALEGITGEVMLTPHIAEAFDRAVTEMSGREGVRRVGEGRAGATVTAPPPVLLEADGSQLLACGALQSEMFGAAALVVRYDGVEQLMDLADALDGQLTASVHATERDFDEVRLLLPALEAKAGRIVFGGWPTGVEVTHAMMHGGPFPATSDSRSTSVGSAAIERFLRPVAYQSMPDELLPEALKDANPWALERRIDGVLEPGR